MVFNERIDRLTSHFLCASDKQLFKSPQCLHCQNAKRSYVASTLSREDRNNEAIRVIADLIKQDSCKNIVTLAGAGISTSANIPDFRSENGFYAQIKQKFNLPYPEVIFDIDYFLQNPEPFYMIARDLYPGRFKPTPTHYFIKLLAVKGKLRRHYTQNIDNLERLAGIPEEKIIEAHGSFFTAHCLNRFCKQQYSHVDIRDEVMQQKVPRCRKCGGVIKPDIVFFGESLPSQFFQYQDFDFAACDLLLIMGTSLQVYPFASLINLVGAKVPRLLINKELPPEISGFHLWAKSSAFQWTKEGRDYAFIGSCDDAVKLLVARIGWQAEFEEISQK